MRAPRMPAALPSCVALAAFAYGFARSPWAGDWLTTQWYFSYELEFVRRGLAGTALRLVVPDPSPALIEWVAIAVAVALGASLLGYARWATRARDPSLQRSFALVLAACPATLMQFGADTGRFDHLNYLVALASLMLLDRGGYAWAALLAGVGVLVHEGYLLLFLPVVVAAAGYVAVQRGDSVARAAPIALVGAAAFAAVEWVGDLAAMSRVEFTRQVACAHGLDPTLVYSSSASLFRNLDAKVLRHSARILPNARDVVVYLGVVLVAFSPQLWIALRLAADLRRRLPPPRRLLLAALVASPFCALAMLAVGGADWSRWVACAVVNSLLVALFLLRREPGWQPAFPLDARLLLALVAACFALGPLGELRAFPWSVDVRPLPARPLGLPRELQLPGCTPDAPVSAGPRAGP